MAQFGSRGSPLLFSIMGNDVSVEMENWDGVFAVVTKDGAI